MAKNTRFAIITKEAFGPGESVVVFAGFTDLYKSIATSGVGAVIGAGIGIDIVAIVACFIHLLESITASSIHARIGTIVGVYIIGIIAFFAGLNKTIATSGIHAVIGAGVGIIVVAVIAFFISFNLTISAKRTGIWDFVAPIPSGGQRTKPGVFFAKPIFAQAFKHQIRTNTVIAFAGVRSGGLKINRSFPFESAFGFWGGQARKANQIGDAFAF